MSGEGLIDALYAGFARTLPRDLEETALGLACALGLAPTADIPWSEVFGHEVTLAAPLLFVEGMPGVREGAVRDAVLAHMLAVIEAFGTDRIEDGQVSASGALVELLERLRVGRDEALARVAPGAVDAGVDGRLADAETKRAITEERALLLGGRPATMAAYEATSIGKQRVGFPASLALAHAAGFGEARRESVSRALAGVWMGLQIHDDVIDWKDDLARGGAWAVAIARAGGAAIEGLDPEAAGPPVLASGVLARMLERSRAHYRRARRHASAIGARRLAAWAGEREVYVRDLARREAQSAGFALRAHALSTWAREVLG